MCLSPVNGFVVPFRRHNFRCEIVGRPAQCPGDVWDFFCEAKVCNFEMAVPIEEQVFWLQISIDDVHRVQVIESQSDLGGIELGNWIREALDRHVSFDVRREREAKPQTCDFRSKLNSSPPSTKSITMYRFLESWNVPQRVIRKGCLTLDSMRRSSLVCSTCFILTTWAFFSTLMA